jgi:hypothetical protein
MGYEEDDMYFTATIVVACVFLAALLLLVATWFGVIR